MERITIPEYMEAVVDSYYKNSAKRLYGIVDKILFKLRLADTDRHDFYSLANEVFMYAVRDYDSSKPFDGFLYSCLYKKFCSEMTRRCREKRKADRMSVSIDEPLGEDPDITLGEIIADDFDMEKEILEDPEGAYSGKVQHYLDRLSFMQKEVLKLNIAGYHPNEIRKELHITEKQYRDCITAIHSYRNVSILF